MKYSDLKSEIVNILYSSDYDLQMKFYDSEGNTTLDVDTADWGFIKNTNTVFEFPIENTPELYIWKDSTTMDSDFKMIIQRIRRLAVLNGVSVQIRMYNNLNQREVYNLIKTSLTKRQNMENTENEITESLCKIIQISKSTQKSSDSYLSEELKTQKRMNVLNNIINELSNIKALAPLTETFKLLSNFNTKREVEDLISTLSVESQSVIKENTQNITNCCEFVKKAMINNNHFKPTQTIFMLENVKVYVENVERKNERLISAFNKLLSLSENCSVGTDLLRIIRDNKLCEEFNVSKKELLDMFITEQETIKKTYNFVIENYKGEKTYFSQDLAFGIKSLATYLNNGGKNDDCITNNIVQETIKYNHISSFIKEYKDNFRVRPYITKFKELFETVVSNLSNSKIDYTIFELYESAEIIDCLPQYTRLCKEIGVEHPAIKYIAIEEAKQHINNEIVLQEAISKDLENISNGLRPFIIESDAVAAKIITDKIGMVNDSINEVSHKEVKNTAMIMYNNLCESNSAVSVPVASSLFNIMHSKKPITNETVDFLNSLRKYLI